MTLASDSSGSARVTRRAAAAAARALAEQAEMVDFDTQSIASSSNSNKRKATTSSSGPRKRTTSTSTFEFDADSDFDAQEDIEDDEEVVEHTQKFAIPEGDSDDIWLISEATRKNSHNPLTITQRRELEKGAGRGLIPWLRPLMNEKLLLFIVFELARHQIEVPWDAIAHRLHPGSSGSAIHQHLARVRLDVASKGHLVPPPVPKAGPTGFSVDPTVRGYIRQDDEETEKVQLLPALYRDVWEDRKVNLPDSYDANLKLQAAELEQRKKAKGKSTGKARKMAVPKSRKSSKAAQSARARRATGDKTIPNHPKTLDTIVVNTGSALESDSETECDENVASAATTITPSSAPESASPATETGSSDMSTVDIDAFAEIDIFIRNSGVLNYIDHTASQSASADAAAKITFTEYLQSGAGGASPIHSFGQTLNDHTVAGASGIQFGLSAYTGIEPGFTIFEDETRTETQE